MIKSRHNTFGFWALTLICIVFFILFFCGLTKSLFGIGFNLRNGESLNELHKELILFFGLTIFWCLILSTQVKNITIDTISNTISFQNIFTRNNKVYLFTDFDGYIETAIPHDNISNPYKTIGFVKEKKVMRRIDRYYYSNFEDLKRGLNGIKNLGSIKLNFWKRIKMLLKLPVL